MSDNPPDVQQALHDLELRLQKIDAKVDVGNLELKNEISEAVKDIDILKNASSLYVTRERYVPVERLVFGFVALVLSAIVMALISLVVIGHPG